MRILMLLFLPLVAAVCQAPPPVIDVHMHAGPAKGFGALGIKACPGDVAKTWPAVDPRSTRTTPDDLEDCPNPIYSLKTDSEVFETTKRLMQKFNITGVLSGPEEYVTRWGADLGSRVIPAIMVPEPGNPSLGHLHELVDSKKVRVLGEVTLQYAGISPADPRFEPYWDLAERKDIPVGIHIGPGPAGGVDVWNQKSYRVALSDPELLEPVLIRHPKLRVYVMHAGWPMGDRMVHMLYTYPRLYVDTGVIDWYLPRKEFHQYLKRLVDAGFCSRIMFGSDQMIWPQMIEVAIESINSAEFLTQQQKRDVLYNNAVRFLRLQEADGAR
jgi:uncharacterized protein